MCKDALPNVLLEYEQRLNGTKITKPGIQKSKRGYD